MANTRKKESYFRQKIYGDRRVKYIYSQNSNILHDKNCVKARGIPDDVLFYSEKYLPDMEQCSYCARRAYIRAGAKDMAQYRDYERLFQAMKVEDENLRHMYLDCGMKTRVKGKELIIYDREDTWKMVSIDNRGRLQLLHNNYKVLRNGERKFVKGFHVQNDLCYSTDFWHALRLIETYSYDKHKAAKQMQQSQEQVERIEPVTQPKEIVSKEPVESSQKGGLAQWFRQVFHRKKKLQIRVDGFQPVDEKGMPADGEKCIYIWKNASDQYCWQVGVYEQRTGRFVVNFKDVRYVIGKDKVVAWKHLDDEVMSLS